MVRGGRTIRGASLTPTPKAETPMPGCNSVTLSILYEQIKYLQLLTTNPPAVRVYDRIARRRKFTGVSLVTPSPCYS